MGRCFATGPRNRPETFERIWRLPEALRTSHATVDHEAQQEKGAFAMFRRHDKLGLQAASVAILGALLVLAVSCSTSAGDPDVAPSSDTGAGVDTSSGMDSDTTTVPDSSADSDGADSGVSAQHDHFDDMVSALSTSGHLHFSSSMREGSGDGYLVDDYVRKSPAGLTAYDSEMEATIFYTNNNFYDDIMFTFEPLSSGDVWVQVETYFHPEWAQGGSEVGNAKFWRPRKNSLGGDKRLFDMQIRCNNTCTDDPACPAGLPTVRCYDCSLAHTNPIKHPNNTDEWQPGGDTAANRKINYTASDHVADGSSPFLYLTGRWIRETWHLDLDTHRFKYWMSDENTDTTLLIADVEDPSLGYFLDGSNYGLDGVNFNANLSTGDPDPKIRHWHRNFIVGHDLSDSEAQDLLSGRPGGQ
jgi:hypothetical protein